MMSVYKIDKEAKTKRGGGGSLSQIQHFRVIRVAVAFLPRLKKIPKTTEPCASQNVPSIVNLLQSDVIWENWVAPPDGGGSPAKQAASVDKQKVKKKKSEKKQRQPVVLALLSDVL